MALDDASATSRRGGRGVEMHEEDEEEWPDEDWGGGLLQDREGRDDLRVCVHANRLAGAVPSNSVPGTSWLQLHVPASAGTRPCDGLRLRDGIPRERRALGHANDAGRRVRHVVPNGMSCCWLRAVASHVHEPEDDVAEVAVRQILPGDPLRRRRDTPCRFTARPSCPRRRPRRPRASGVPRDGGAVRTRPHPRLAPTR